RLRVPVLQLDPDTDGGGEHRVATRAERHPEGRRGRARLVAAERLGARRQRRALSGGAFRRRAAAGRDRESHRARTRTRSRRRAHRQSRPRDRGTRARAARRRLPPAPSNVGDGDAQPRGHRPCRPRVDDPQCAARRDAVMRALLLRASARFYLRHPWQLALAIAGVALGVAVYVGVALANDSARRAFELSSEAVTGRTTHRILPVGGALPEQVFTDLVTRVGIATAAPVVEAVV